MVLCQDIKRALRALREGCECLAATLGTTEFNLALEAPTGRQFCGMSHINLFLYVIRSV